MNGRVTFDGTPPKNYELYEGELNKYDFKNSLKGIQDSDILSNAFFSKRNINCIQKQIEKSILDKTNYTIGRQSDLQLQIIMRSIYLQYSKNLNCDYTNQIKDLNKKVTDFSVDRIVIEISQFLEYRKEVSKIPTPISLPTNLSNAGEKSFSLFKPI
jgi:hypothetical protein|uniref:Minor capsid protein P8 central region domain-containing protein n=1 Tax=viral metagenome TaxID=1070528 RepID=A0A6C0J8G9_9ZZZZ